MNDAEHLLPQGRHLLDRRTFLKDRGAFDFEPGAASDATRRWAFS